MKVMMTIYNKIQIRVALQVIIPNIILMDSLKKNLYLKKAYQLEEILSKNLINQAQLIHLNNFEVHYQNLMKIYIPELINFNIY